MWREKRMLARAIMFAAIYHCDEDERGRPFILHAIDVMNNLAIKNNEKLSTIAVLHGILERTDITEERLRKEFPDDVVDAVVALTRKPNQSYFEYIEQVSKNPHAVVVKISDLDFSVDRSLAETKEIEQYTDARDTLLQKVLGGSLGKVLGI